MNKISNKVYYDPQILQEERSGILKQSWILVALSSQLPRPNTEWLFEIAGHSIHLTRDAFGKTALHIKKAVRHEAVGVACVRATNRAYICTGSTAPSLD